MSCPTSYLLVSTTFSVLILMMHCIQRPCCLQKFFAQVLTQAQYTVHLKFLGTGGIALGCQTQEEGEKARVFLWLLACDEVSGSMKIIL